MIASKHRNKTVGIWWIKRDFRLIDNEALHKSLESCDYCIPIYLLESEILHGPDWGPFHSQAVSSAIKSLGSNLEHYGSSLLVMKEPPISAIGILNDKLSKYGLTVNGVFSHQETGLAHTYARDNSFEYWCNNNNIVWHQYINNGVVRGPINRDYWDRSFQNFVLTPSFEVPKIRLKRSFPENIKLLFGEFCYVNVEPQKPSSLENKFLNTGEKVAHCALKEFLHHRSRLYWGGISSMNKAQTSCSRLSVALAWGVLSLRTVIQHTGERYAELKESNETSGNDSEYRWLKSLENFRSRLSWHAHFVQKLESEVDMEFRAVNAAYRNNLPYIYEDDDPIEFKKRLEAWLFGNTGFPAIDAAMRFYQLHGWLNFRSRAMITSFACNALRLPWQVVLYESAKLMGDYVPGIHVSQIQMQAGITGINTIRVYSPQKQLIDHDPQCKFVRSMIPELEKQKTVDILALSISRETNEYPAPIIDFKNESKIMKDALYRISTSDECQHHSRKVYDKHGSRKRQKDKRRVKKKQTETSATPQMNLFFPE
jgi:deoxyribodipyrimidine photo-lyase